MNLIMSHHTNPSSVALKPASLARKRELGAFYTPFSLTKILCDWAIQSADDVVLEPSFGGCTFLDASIQRMRDLGEITTANLYGCDIDPNAFEFLRARIASVHAENFHLCDFLQWGPENISGRRVDAVIGNPPYVRYSKLNQEQREAIHLWEEKYGLRLNRRASLWTYFTFHALNFLKKGGRMAWVLPASFMTAQYAAGLRNTLSMRFQKIAFFTLSERIFLMEGTEERALIVLADGFGETQTEAKVTSSYLNGVADLESSVASWQQNNAEWTSSDSNFSRGLVPYEADKLMSDLELDPNVVLLGSLAQIGIGVVTGDTRYFIKSSGDWRAEGIGRSHLTYIVPKSRWVTGLCLRKVDRELHEQEGIPCLALDAPATPRASALLRYLARYDEETISKNATFAKRAIWFRFLDGRVPDALFVFMTHLGPRMVVNDAKADTTNGLYRVQFKVGAKRKAKLIAISLQTTFAQLAAEQLGRALGSGALKLEPCDAKLLPIFLPKKTAAQTSVTFEIINQYMRSGNADLARNAADQFIFSDSEAFKTALEQLEFYLETARRRRMRNKQKAFAQ